LPFVSLELYIVLDLNTVSEKDQIDHNLTKMRT